MSGTGRWVDIAEDGLGVAGARWGGVLALLTVG